MSTYFTIENAKSGRAKCKKCKEPLQKGHLRFGSHSTGGDFEMVSWCHVECFKIPRKVAKEFTGDTAHQDFIREMVTDNTIDKELDDDDKLMDVAQKMGTKVTSTKKRKADPDGDGDSGFMATVKRNAASILGQDGDEEEDDKNKDDIMDETVDDVKKGPAKKKTKMSMSMSAEDKKQAIIYNKYCKKKLDELKDILRWNHGMVSGKKDFLLARIIDGECYGRLAPCTVCEYGKLKVVDGENKISCGGYFDEEGGFHKSCFAKFAVDKAPRLQPWYSDSPTEEEKEAMEAEYSKESDDKKSTSNLPEKFLKSVKKINWDLSSRDNMKKSAGALVDLIVADTSPIAALEGDDDEDGSGSKKVKMAVGKMVLQNKDKSAEEILDLVVEKYGMKEAKKKAKAAKAEVTANVCAVPANGKIHELMTELSDLYYKESNTNAGNSYRKVAEAVRTLGFEITASNAKGLGAGKKTKVVGVGKGSADKMQEFFDTGKIAKLEEKRAANA